MADDEKPKGAGDALTSAMNYTLKTEGGAFTLTGGSLGAHRRRADEAEGDLAKAIAELHESIARHRDQLRELVQIAAALRIDSEQTGEPESEAVRLRRMDHDLERERLAFERHKHASQIALETRKAEAQEAGILLTHAQAQLDAETKRAVAAETAVAKVQAESNEGIERLKARHPWISGGFSLAALIIGALLGHFLK